MLGRVLIAGAGAIGSVIGGFLKKQGEDVTLLGRPDQIEAIKKEGLEISGIWGEHRVSGFELVSDLAELGPDFDLIFLTVKSYDTNSAIREVAPKLKPSGLVVSAQNGLGNLEAVAQVVGPERTLGGRVIFGAEILSPGKVRVTVYADPVMIGGFAPALSATLKNQIEKIVAALNGSGVPSGYAEEIRPYLWAKILYNCPLNPLGALLDVNYGALADNPETRKIMEEVIREIFLVARAEKVTLFWKDPDHYAREFFDRLVPSTRNHRASMIADLKRNKPTEIEAMNGWILKLGEKYGIPVPYNETLTRMIRFRAAAQK
jgi:2-dehydropantoate 2-reductase